MINPEVAIVILNWNRKEDTAECLESLSKISYENTITLVVDNGSSDSSVPYIRERFPRAILLENGVNLGFAEGNNVGIRFALENYRPEYILLLNNDTVVDSRFLDELVHAAASDERIGMVGPKVYYYYDPKKINAAGAKMVWLLGIAKNIGLGQPDDGSFDIKRETDCVYGCAFLIKTKAIEDIGLLDRRFFIILEETDWCLRARKAGYKIVYTPDSVVYHKEGVSGNKQSRTSVYYSHRNRLLLIKKNYSPLMMLASALPLASMFFMTICYYSLRRDFGTVGTIGKAYCDGLLTT
jgi:GT2 family glycosyltransferase